ncbi:MAG: dihydrolipoyl dehydrogenase [Lachnospiraceae bacterium]|jgi:dihydrolipoamide dehydrogenase|nr:dihydrolipoyl dehydrogenase [Lachnospiraceae bacterium]
MTKKHVEVVVIGGGPGGYVAAIYAAKSGKQVALVEKEHLGGTCLNIGCIPTKALVKSAEVFDCVKKAQEFGVLLEGDVKPDMNAIMDRKEQVVERLVGGVAHILKKNNVEVITGTASFVDDKTIEVSGEETLEITFDDAIIATGSKVAKVPIPGIDLPFVLNSTTALSLRELPKSIVIIGGGVIGLEFAFLYRHLGVEVTVIEFMDRLVSVLDSDASSEILRQAKKAGIKVSTSAKVTQIAKGEDGKALVSYERKEKLNEVSCEKVLVAIGRSPQMEGLGIENTSIELLEKGRGIKVNEAMKTSVDHIYAIGDVNNLIQLAHAASHQGMLAVDDIVGKQTEAFEKNCVPSVIFTTPEIASVGVSEDYLKEQGITYKVGKFQFNGNGKAVTMGQANGFCKILKNEQNEIIGATIVGPDASTLIATLTLAIRNHMTDSDITKTIFAHPTTGEVIHEAALDLSIGCIHS